MRKEHKRYIVFVGIQSDARFIVGHKELSVTELKQGHISFPELNLCLLDIFHSFQKVWNKSFDGLLF